jgi:predicted ATPase
LGADFVDPTLRTAFDINSASYGSKQLLTIITQIFWSKSGDILLIEEPEISLHPESQALIQELFAEAVAAHKQIICSTHSPSFILSLSRVIGKKRLSKDDVAVYHVEKGAEGTRTRRLELNDRGFVKGWIPSYIKIENQLFDEWAETLGHNSNSS